MIFPAVNGCINENLRGFTSQIFLICLLLLSSCQPVCTKIEPQIHFIPQARHLQSSPFEPFSKEEFREEWGKEFHIGLSFGHEMDLYRAITAFKRAQYLLPAKRSERRLQIEYCIFESYYLGRKYSDAVEIFELGPLYRVSNTFPAYKELCIMLYECYMRKGRPDLAEQMMQRLQSDQAAIAQRLDLWNALMEMDFDRALSDSACQPDNEEIADFIAVYETDAKSVSKARTLNGVLPGLGYLYVGQKQAAVTSFLINALFTGASYYFFKNGNVPMGIVTASLESGWYLGGINGAGLAAQEYNKGLYEDRAKELMSQHRLFPFLMLQTTF
ncbi:MAG: tetratricopeptide repeat protein [Parachlamydia sp.]|nr:tetratricopeptide repeat protein [Parachlamydia sp.]